MLLYFLAEEEAVASDSALALMFSVIGLAVALTSLIWQIIKHFLDGGRVRVYLNAAILERGYALAVNRKGKHRLQHNDIAEGVLRGKAQELAQLVVENPGRSAVTIYGPGLYIKGHGVKNHTISPLLISTDGVYGMDEAIDASVFRLEPYARVTFLFDYWRLMPGLMSKYDLNRIYLRGFVGVAGRTNRPSKSKLQHRWKIKKGAYTAIEDSPPMAPIAVIWRELQHQFSDSEDGEPEENSIDPVSVSRKNAFDMLDKAMSQFTSRPEREVLEEVLDQMWERKYGVMFPNVMGLFFAYEALDRMDWRVTEWTNGLWHFPYEIRRMERDNR